MKFNIKQKGFTLVELLIVVTAGLAITAIAAAYGKNASASTFVDKDNKFASQMVSCIKKTRTGLSYDGLDEIALIDSRCLDGIDAVNEDRDTILTPYAGEVTLSVVEFNGIDDQGVEVTMIGYDQKSCVEAALHRIKMSRIVQVNGDDIKTLEEPNVPIDAIPTACSDEDNEILFVVSR